MSDTAELFVDCRLDLGEGPIWHGPRGEFLWFDVNNGVLFRATPDGKVLGDLRFGEPAAAAAVIDEIQVAVITATGLVRVNLDTGDVDPIADVEADNAVTRSNDSRVDPAGGFWIGTMGRHAEPGAGAYYQYRLGELTLLYPNITIPNSTCFSPDGRLAYFADSPKRQIMKVAISPDTGRPVAEPEVFVDLTGQSAVPDGSVVDSAGFLWNAEYGGSRVVRYAPDGSVDREVRLPVSQVTCPCLGGPELTTLFITTATQNMNEDQLADEPHAGSCFRIEVDVPGQTETPIRL